MWCNPVFSNVKRHISLEKMIIPTIILWFMRPGLTNCKVSSPYTSKGLGPMDNSQMLDCHINARLGKLLQHWRQWRAKAQSVNKSVVVTEGSNWLAWGKHKITLAILTHFKCQKFLMLCKFWAVTSHLSFHVKWNFRWNWLLNGKKLLLTKTVPIALLNLSISQWSHSKIWHQNKTACSE